MECFIKKYLQHGLIEPGYEKLSFTLGDRTYRADVLSDGTILDENSETFGDVPEWVHNAIATPGQILSIVKYGETPLSAFEQIFATTDINPKQTNISSNYGLQNKSEYLIQDSNPYNINSPQFSPLPSPLPSVTPPLSSQQQQQQQQPLQHMQLSRRHHHYSRHSYSNNTSSSTIQVSSSIRTNKNRYVNHLHNSLDYFKLGFEKGIFKSGKNNLRYKSDTIDVRSSLDKECHVIDDNNNYFESVIDWIKSINQRNNNNKSSKSSKINWKNLYYNDKNLSDYEDLILNGSTEKVEVEEDDDDESDEYDDNGNEIEEDFSSNNNCNNNCNNLYYTNDKYRNETRPPESCYYNNEISSGSDNNSSNNINKLPSDDDDDDDDDNNNNNSLYYRNIQEKMEDFDDDYSFIDNSKDIESNEWHNDLYKLIKQNQLSPGVDILELRHNGCCYRASLMKNGKIRSSDGMKYSDIKSWSRSLTSENIGVNDLMNSIYYKSSPIKYYLCELKNRPIVN